MTDSSPPERLPAVPFPDEAALCRWLDGNVEMWLRQAYNRLGDRQFAEDAVAEAMLAFYRAWQEGKTVARPMAWMAEVIDRRAAERRRNEHSHRAMVQQWAVEQPSPLRGNHPSAVPPESDATREALLRRVMEFLPRLGERQREVLHWRVFDRLPVKEIARRSGCAQSTVRGLWRQALARLKPWLRRRDE